MVSACTCSVRGGAVAQFVADHAGEVAAEGSLGHNQGRSILGDRPHGAADGDLLVKPAEVGVRPPGLAANQRGVRHVDADWDVVHRLCKDRQKMERIKKNNKKMKRGDKNGG